MTLPGTDYDTLYLGMLQMPPVMQQMLSTEQLLMLPAPAPALSEQ